MPTDRAVQLRGLGLVVLILLGGCARESAEEYLLKNAVRKYNRALVETYRMTDPALLSDVATEQEVRKVDILITTLQMQNKVLRASLDRIRFDEVQRRAESQAEVKTSEDWSYEHVDRKTRQRAGVAKRVHYELIYSLERREGRWIVASLRHDRERGNGSIVARALAGPGFLGTRAPVLPDVAMLGLLGLVASWVFALWCRGTSAEPRWRWAMVGAYASLLVAGASWAAQSLLVGNPEVRETLSPLSSYLATGLAVAWPVLLALAVVSGAAVLFRTFRDPTRSPKVMWSPLGIIGLTSWVTALAAGVAQYWLLFVI